MNGGIHVQQQNQTSTTEITFGRSIYCTKYYSMHSAKTEDNISRSLSIHSSYVQLQLQLLFFFCLVIWQFRPRLKINRTPYTIYRNLNKMLSTRQTICFTIRQMITLLLSDLWGMQLAFEFFEAANITSQTRTRLLYHRVLTFVE